MRVIEEVHQITLVPELLDKANGASVHLSATESVLSDDGKVYRASGGAADVHELDEEIVADARALFAKVAQRRADRAKVAVKHGAALTEAAKTDNA